MHSNEWNKNESFFRTNHNTPLKKTCLPHSTSSLSFQNQRPLQDSSFVVLKMDVLSKKLKRKPTQQYLSHSRYTNLKSTKCPQPIRISESQNDWSVADIKIWKQQLDASNDAEIEILEEKVTQLQEKRKDIKQFRQLHRKEISNEIQQLQKIVKQIKERSELYQPIKKEFCIYSDLIQQNKKESQSIIPKKSDHRVMTLSSACKEPSLLLSFKKNTQEDQGCCTLKYSQDSNARQPLDSLGQGWHSFQKDRARKRLQFKNQTKQSVIIPSTLGQKYFETAQTEIIQHLNQIKNDILLSFDESNKIYQKFEQALDQLVEEIAEQKVERQHEAKTIQKQQKTQIDQLFTNIVGLQRAAIKQQEQLDLRIMGIRNEYIDKLAIQKAQRKLQERIMIKIMLDAVAFLQ